MASPLNLPRTDPNKVERGIWVRFDGPIEFRIAREGNALFMAEVRKLTADERPAARHRKGISEAQLDAVLRAASKFILTDWRGLTCGEGDDAKPWEHTPERAYEILTDPAWSEVAEFVWAVAKDSAAYREDAVESAEGN